MSSDATATSDMLTVLLPLISKAEAVEFLHRRKFFLMSIYFRIPHFPTRDRYSAYTFKAQLAVYTIFSKI
jgi:hypothetical protein